MYRWSSILTIGTVLAIGPGCRCWDSSGSCSGSNGNCSSQQYKLVGNTKFPAEGCYDAITGVPVPCPPAGSTMVIPGGYPTGPVPQPMTPPNELPYPSPITIPPTSIPSAVPSAAPGFGASVNPNLTQPTRIGPNR